MFAEDLVVATSIIGVLSLLAFLCGSRARPESKGLFVTTILTAFIFSVCFQGKLGWARLVPHSSAVQFSNLTPILVAFIAGFARRGLDLRQQTRPFAVTALLLLAVACLVSPIMRSAVAPLTVAAISKTNGFLVLQRHDSTCAPASAASLLRFHGIDSDEAAMIGPCLTSQFGTEALGLYRGITIGCEGTSCNVELASRDQHRWKSAGQLPNIALVRFSENEYETGLNLNSPQRPRSQPQWFTGSNGAEDGHAVVVLGYQDGRWSIADPAIGLVTWSDAELASRFTGDAIYITRP